MGYKFKIGDRVEAVSNNTSGAIEDRRFSLGLLGMFFPFGECDLEIFPGRIYSVRPDECDSILVDYKENRIRKIRGKRDLSLA